LAFVGGFFSIACFYEEDFVWILKGLGTLTLEFSSWAAVKGKTQARYGIRETQTTSLYILERIT